MFGACQNLPSDATWCHLPAATPSHETRLELRHICGAKRIPLRTSLLTDGPGNYLTSASCSEYFNNKIGQPQYFSLLTAAVQNQVPWDGFLSTISQYAAGWWN